MTAHGPRQAASAPHSPLHRDRPGSAGDDPAVQASERAASDEWAVLVRQRRSGQSRRDYVRQIVIDAALVVVVLLIIALLS